MLLEFIFVFLYTTLVLCEAADYLNYSSKSESSEDYNTRLSDYDPVYSLGERYPFAHVEAFLGNTYDVKQTQQQPLAPYPAATPVDSEREYGLPGPGYAQPSSDPYYIIVYPQYWNFGQFPIKSWEEKEGFEGTSTTPAPTTTPTTKRPKKRPVKVRPPLPRPPGPPPPPPPQPSLSHSTSPIALSPPKHDDLHRVPSKPKRTRKPNKSVGKDGSDGYDGIPLGGGEGLYHKYFTGGEYTSGAEVPQNMLKEYSFLGSAPEEDGNQRYQQFYHHEIKRPSFSGAR